MDVFEMIRMMRSGASDRVIVATVGRNRRTVAKFRKWAKEQGLLAGDLPSVVELHQRLEATLPAVAPPQQTSSVAGYEEEIRAMRGRGMEMAAIRVRLEEQHGQPVSYDAVRRLVQRLEPATPEAFVRVEVAPGSEAQVDFGYAGCTLDPATGKPRKTWVFVMTLSYSRHLYAELVYDQRVPTWLTCHRRAFEFFGGVPGRVVLDNLATAIVKACREDPLVQQSYRECAEHYGFLIDPNPVATPRMKGKVEKGGVHYVKRNCLAGREPERIDTLNVKLSAWCIETAGQRVHGTTRARPLVRFETVERSALAPLPAAAYDMAVWSEGKLHRDCHMTVDKAYYSAPFRLVGQQLLARVGSRTVSVYTLGYELLYTHDRKAPGERATCLDHLPPEKVANLVITRADCQAQAQAIGPATSEVVGELLANRPVDKLRVAGRLLRLSERYGPTRLEQACRRALHFGDGTGSTVRRILEQGLEDAPLSTEAVAVKADRPRIYLFARQAHDLATVLLAAGGWR